MKSPKWIKTVMNLRPRVEHIPVNLRVSLTVLNPYFTGVIQKSDNTLLTDPVYPGLFYKYLRY